MMATAPPGGWGQAECVEGVREEAEVEEAARKEKTGNPGHPEMENLESQEDRVEEEEGEEEEERKGEEEGHQVA